MFNSCRFDKPIQILVIVHLCTNTQDKVVVGCFHRMIIQYRYNNKCCVILNVHITPTHKNIIL